MSGSRYDALREEQAKALAQAEAQQQEAELEDLQVEQEAEPYRPTMGVRTSGDYGLGVRESRMITSQHAPEASAQEAEADNTQLESEMEQEQLAEQDSPNLDEPEI